MSCRFSTYLQLWQGKEVGYGCNSPTCAWRWIWPKWPKTAFRLLHWRKQNISLRNHAPSSKKRWSGVLSFMRIKGWRLGYKDTRQCFIITKRPPTFLVSMALQRMRRHAGDVQQQVHLPTADADCGLQSRLHLHPTRHPPQQVTLPELDGPQLAICRLDTRIPIQVLLVRTFLKMIRILSTISILIQICWLMMVSTLSVVW